jgi:hypothetical protein
MGDLTTGLLVLGGGPGGYTAAGVVKLLDQGTRLGQTRKPAPSRCRSGTRLLPPHLEGFGAGTSVLGDGHQVTPWTEVAIDHGVR